MSPETIALATWISLWVSLLALVPFAWASTGRGKGRWFKPGRGNAILRELVSPPLNIPVSYYGDSGLWHRRYLYTRKNVADWPASIIASVSLVTIVVAVVTLASMCFLLPKTLGTLVPLLVGLGALLLACDGLVFMHIRGQTEIEPDLGMQDAGEDTASKPPASSDFPELRDVSPDTAPALLKHLASHPEAASIAILTALGWDVSDWSLSSREGEADKAYELVLEMALQPPIQSRAAALQSHIANALDPPTSVEGDAAQGRRRLGLRLVDALRQYDPPRKRYLALVLDSLLAGLLLLVGLPLLGMLIWVCARASGGRKRGILVGHHCGLAGREILSFRLNTGAVSKTDSGESTSAIGRLLGWTGLDRLPALTGVLRGEYSFSGPIPLPAGYIFALVILAVRTGGLSKDEARRLALDRLRVRPGLFGVAQAYGILLPGQMSCLDYARLDARYPAWNPFWDFLMRTSLFVTWPLFLAWRLALFALNMAARDPNMSSRKERPTYRITRAIKKVLSSFPKRPVERRTGDEVLFRDAGSIFFGHRRF